MDTDLLYLGMNGDSLDETVQPDWDRFWCWQEQLPSDRQKNAKLIKAWIYW